MHATMHAFPSGVLMRLLLLVVLCACNDSRTALRDSNPLSENDGPDGCFDGIDNDNDYLVDCLDDDCNIECDVENLPPHSTVVTIAPIDPGTDDDLTCVGTATDPEAGALTWSYTWTRDGVFVSDEATIPSSMTHGYDVWSCEAVPNDGELDGVTGSADVEVLSDNACTALAFDLTHRVEVPRFAGQDLVGTDFTVESWAYIDASNANGNVPILFSDPESDLSGWRFVVVGDAGARALRVQLGGGVPTLPAVSSPIGTVPEGRWVHLAATYELASGQVRLYIDGTGVHSDVLSDPLISGASLENLAIGGTLAGGGYHLIGMLDEVRISTVIRYDGDFEPLAWFEPDADTLALWHFDEGAGTTAGEAIASFDGAISGASWVSSSACDTLP